MSLFSKFFGSKKDASGNPELPSHASMMEMMKNPAMRKLAMELRERLSREEQQELMRLAMSRDAAKIQEFMKTHLPDLEESLKDSDIPGV